MIIANSYPTRGRVIIFKYLKRPMGGGGGGASQYPISHCFLAYSLNLFPKYPVSCNCFNLNIPYPENN